MNNLIQRLIKIADTTRDSYTKEHLYNLIEDIKQDDLKKSLELQLEEARIRIEENNDSIKSCKNNLVDIEKDPSIPIEFRSIFIAQWQDLLNEVRIVKKHNLNTYLDILNTIIDKIMYHKNNAVELGNFIVDTNGTVKAN